MNSLESRVWSRESTTPIELMTVEHHLLMITDSRLRTLDS